MPALAAPNMMSIKSAMRSTFCESIALLVADKPQSCKPHLQLSALGFGEHMGFVGSD